MVRYAVASGCGKYPFPLIVEFNAQKFLQIATTEKAPLSSLPSNSLLSTQATIDGTIFSVNATSNDSVRDIETASSIFQASKKRRRVFVDVPQAPYDIRRAPLKEGMAYTHISPSSIARSSRKEECLPHSTVKETATRTDASVSNASQTVSVSPEGKEVGYVRPGLPNKSLDAVIDRLAKPGNQSGDHQNLSNAKFGPPFGVARAAKSSYWPKHAPKDQSTANTKATVLHDVSPGQTNNVLQTIFPLAIESYVDSGRGFLQKRNSSGNLYPFHAKEEITNKKRKVEHQSSGGEADHPDTPWQRTYYSMVSDKQVESLSPTTKWASQGTTALNTSQMTLASLQLQRGSSTLILGNLKVNAATTKDGNAMDELSPFEDITHSSRAMDTAPQSPLLTSPANYSIFPDNDGLDEIWGQAMLSPSSMFEVNDINFDDNLDV